MGFRFQRRLQIIPGVRLNVGTRATSVSIGHRGAWLTVGPHGRRRATLGWPGTGISYTSTLRPGQRPNAAPSALLWLVVLLGVVGLVAFIANV